MILFFKNMRIKSKIIMVTMLTCVAVLTVISATMVFWAQNNLRDSIVRNLNTQAEILADNSTAAMAFENAKNARETLAALRTQSSVISAAIYTSENKLFASYNRNEDDSNVEPFEFLKRGKNGDKFLIVSSNIVLDGIILGKIVIKSDMSILNKAFRRDLKIISTLLAVAISVAYLMSSNLQKIISNPILALTKVAKAVSQENEYSARAVKRSNDEVGELIDSFNNMLEQIQHRDVQLVDMNKNLSSSNLQLQQFIYVASHDLREPVRKISSFAQLLTVSLEGKLNEDEQENFDYMIDGANRMQQMIEALLAYSRVTTKEIIFEDVDLNEAVEQIRSFELAVRFEETGACMSVPESLPTIKGDPAQIRQLLQNLLGNALKYQRQGVVPEITIRAAGQENGMVRIEIEDNGIGIKREQCENVFVMFKRLHSKQEYEGTGIGLAVCKRIIERHEGKIGVSSTYGQGSTFWFQVPVSQTSEKKHMELISTCQA